MKIAIFSGVIPSTTFVEHLIEAIAENHEVYLFGTQQKPKTYNAKTINVYANSTSTTKNLGIALYRFLLIVVSHPKRLKILFSEVKKQNGFYQKRTVFMRVLPVILYKPDIFHVQWAKDLDQWLFLKEKLGMKLILSLRGAHINYSPIANDALATSYKLNFPKLDAFHAVSKAIGQEAQKYNADASKIKVIHSPVKDSTFKYYTPYKASTETTIKLCVVGRFHWVKGYKYLIDACKILSEKGVDFHLTIVASNTISEDVLFQIHQLQLDDQISVIYDLPQTELFPFIKTCDMLLLTSLKEGIANVVLEAMALGVPVISTDCGGMDEVIVPNTTGWLVPVRDSIAIANAVIEVSQTSDERLKQIVKNAHDFVKTNFKALDSIKEFDQLYQSVFD
jgi:colanic acid/amylovoran biosynthesis glycosyltransferase